MGQYIRWQAIIALVGGVLLAVYLKSIVLVKTTVVVPAEGGTYREGDVGAVQYLNPLLAEYNPIDQDITSLIFEGLTRDDGTGNLLPELAENWSVSADGRLYVFVLRKDVKWSDGVPFTSDDVLFTLNLIRSPDFPGNPAWRDLWQSVKIEQVDDYTIRFALDEPFPSFEYYTTIGILPKHLLKDVAAQDLLSHPFNLNPVGTGPFKLKQAFVEHLLLVRNPRYWGQPSRIEQVQFNLYSSAAALNQALEAQEIDGIGRVLPAMIPELENRTYVQLYSAQLPRYSVVYFNLQQPDTLPFFQDSAVRRALLMLLDRQAIIDDAMHGQAVVARGPFLPGSWAYNPQQDYPTYNPIQAAKLLDTAGWVDTDGDGTRDNGGVPFQFKLLVSGNPIQARVAESIARQWQQAGVGVTVEAVGDELSARLQDHQFEAALIQVELFGDPDPYRFWHQSQIDAGQNFGGWDNSAASQDLEQGRTVLNKADRVKYYYDFQRIFADELPALILYYPAYTYALRDTVKNVQLGSIITPADRFRNISAWYLLTQRVIETTAGQRVLP